MAIISAQQLQTIIAEENPVIVDARGGADAFERYNAGHLQGAFFADLETDLSDKTDQAANGGRHPLPEPAQFGAFLAKLGVTPESAWWFMMTKRGQMQQRGSGGC